MRRILFLSLGAALAAAGVTVVSKEAKGEYQQMPSKPIFGKKTHFAGLDPRDPATPDKVFDKKPFKVLFIGAHPDDADFQAGALAHKICKAGGEAVFVSCCNGNKGHQWMNSIDLARRRYHETQASAKTLGINKYMAATASASRVLSGPISSAAMTTSWIRSLRRGRATSRRSSSGCRRSTGSIPPSIFRRLRITPGALRSCAST